MAPANRWGPFLTVFAYKPSQAPGDRPLTAKAPGVGAGLAAPTIAVVGCWPASLNWAPGRRASTLAGVVAAGGAETLRRTAMPDGRATGGCGRSSGDWKTKALRLLGVGAVPRPLLVLKPSRSLGVFFGWLGKGPIAGPGTPAPSEPTERWRPVADGRPAGATLNDLARVEPSGSGSGQAYRGDRRRRSRSPGRTQRGRAPADQVPGWSKAPPGERLGAGERRAQLTTGIEAKPTGPTAALAPGRYPGRRPLLPTGWRLGLPGAPSDTALADTGPVDIAPVDTVGRDTVRSTPVGRHRSGIPGRATSAGPTPVPGDMRRDNTRPGDDGPRARVRRIGSAARVAPTTADRPDRDDDGPDGAQRPPGFALLCDHPWARSPPHSGRSCCCRPLSSCSLRPEASVAWSPARGSRKASSTSRVRRGRRRRRPPGNDGISGQTWRG